MSANRPTEWQFAAERSFMSQCEWLMDLAPISSLQCVDALWRLGFKIEDANDVRVRLVRGDGRRVTVLRHKTIEPIELRVILLTADVEEAAFVEMLQRRTKSGENVQPVGATSGIRVCQSPEEAKSPAKGRAG